jgi:hypothetical protein
LRPSSSIRLCSRQNTCRWDAEAWCSCGMTGASAIHTPHWSATSTEPGCGSCALTAST